MSHNPNVEIAANVIARRLLAHNTDTPLAIANDLEAEGLLSLPSLVPLPRPLVRGVRLLRRRPATRPVAELVPAGAVARSLPSVDETRPVPVAPEPEPVHDQAPEPVAAPVSTELEQQAADWDRRCQSARSLAARMNADYAARAEVHSIRPDQDRVMLLLAEDADLGDWQTWMPAMRIDPGSVRPVSDWACSTAGAYAGVPVVVMGPGVPDVLREAAAACREQVLAQGPTVQYEYAGVVYDLTVPWTDRDGDVWRHYGEFTPLDMPLLAQDADEDHSRCTLASLANLSGPLTTPTVEPEPEPAAPVPAVEAPRPLARAGAMTALELVEQLTGTPGVVQAAVVDDMTVDVELRPANLRAWSEWIRRFAVPVESITSRGPVLTARGSYRGVAVTVLGHDVPEMQAAVVVRPLSAEVCGARFNEARCLLSPHGEDVRHVSPDAREPGVPATAYEWSDDSDRGDSIPCPPADAFAQAPAGGGS